MKQKFSKNKKAFSLVELMITMAIMIIMTALVLSSKNVNKSASDVESAARQVAAQIRALQNESLNGKRFDTDGVGGGDTNACSFKFKIVANAPSYSTSYFSDCGGATIIGSPQSFDLNNRDNVKAVSANEFYFKAPQGNFILVGASTNQIILKSKDDSATASVCVCSSGSVLEKKDDTACGC